MCHEMWKPPVEYGTSRHPFGSCWGFKSRDCVRVLPNDTADVVKMEAEIQWKKLTHVPNLPLLGGYMSDLQLELYIQTPKSETRRGR